MKAVVLDGLTLNSGDLSWEHLKTLCDVTVYDRTPHDQIIERIGDNEIVLTNKTPITKETLDQCPNVKYIGVLATGFNIVDIIAAKNKNIPVTNVPDYSSMSVAQLTFALLLEVCHHVGEHSRGVHQGEWTRSKDFCFWKFPLIELHGKTMGLIGFGSIGQKVANIALSFGMNVLVYNRTVKQELETERLKFASLEDVLVKSDVISLHVPLTDQTNGIINKASIAKMKKGVIVLNTSRGPLINEDDMAQALNEDQVYALGVDVVSREPIEAHNPLLKAKNVIFTPHIAWATIEARKRLMEGIITNLMGFLNGNYINVVNM